jgi:hypothetical protein
MGKLTPMRVGYDAQASKPTLDLADKNGSPRKFSPGIWAASRCCKNLLHAGEAAGGA